MGNPTDRTCVFDGNNLQLQAENNIGNSYVMSLPPSVNFILYRTLVVDVSDYILPINHTYTFQPPLNQGDVFINGAYSCYYLYVEYENSSYSNTSSTIMINNQDSDSLMIYNFLDLNIMNLSTNVGFAINAEAMCDTPGDGSYVIINGNNIGLIAGPDDNSPLICVGVSSSFNYDNGTLFGHGNDIANTTMNGPDGIANIQSYITNNQSVNVSFEYQTIDNSNGGIHSNPIHQLYLTYSTNCGPFDVTVSKDTTICKGATVQLNAASSSSTAVYEWQPAIGLSCTTCPNPIFTGDSSMLYTVRIRNNDSCSVVRPIKINVRPEPKFSSLVIVPTDCGAATGRITVSASTAVKYSINGGTWQTTANFQNLAEGNYTLSIEDAFGCENDTLVTLGFQNVTQAIFNINPNTGAAPLSVQIGNQSVNANLFEWSINGEIFNGNLTNYSFDTSGVYVIQLVAMNNLPYCLDTTSLSILVYDSLIVQVPNVFSPNGDGVNDFYTLYANQDVSYDFQIVNRWGEVVIQGIGTLQKGVSKVIWDGTATGSVPLSNSVTDGVYFLRLEIVDAQGKVMEIKEFITMGR